MELYIALGAVVIIVIALYGYTHMAIKYGISTRDAETMKQKLTDWKNLTYVTAKKLEKYDRDYQTLAYKINRAHTTSDINTIMSEIWEDGPVDRPTSTNVSLDKGNQVVPPKRKGGK